MLLALVLLLLAVPASAAIGSCPSTFVSARDLRADREACTAACNTAGYCCTTNTGGCQKLTCTAGCHIAWHTSDEAACVEGCTKGNAAGCTFTASDGTQFQNCAGHEQCGCAAAANPVWGDANDCSASACAAGCRLAKDVKGHSFYGRKLTDAEIAAAGSSQSTQEAALSAALTSLADHVAGKTALSNADLPTKAATFLNHAALLKQGGAVLTKALNLVDTYEASSSGPLPFPFQRAGSNDGHDLSRAMLVVQQGLLDEVWNSGDQGRTSVVADCSRAVFERRAWQTSTTFPGAAAPPADPTVVHTVKIWATLPKLWGAHVARNREDARKPLGVYLSPGRVAKVTVPVAMVGKEFKVLIGGQTPDNGIKGEHRRMDRVTVKVPITAATTLVTSPLGGSLYVLVPYLADLGTQTVQITGDVVPSPLFQRTRVRQMTNADWKKVRASPGPWADFETDKFMLTVPRSWIYAMEDPTTLMTTYDTTMVGVAEMFGFPIAKRNRKVLYLMPDLHIENPAYGTGYPQVNNNIDVKALVTPPASGYAGYQNHWFVRDPTGWPVCYHELGHSQQQQEAWFQYRGETEAIVNFVWAYLRHMKFGDHFNAAFKGSMSHSNYEPDDAAVHWMITTNFRAGNEMDHSHTELDEFRYQHRGYAKYADIARLFGWGAWTGYYSQRNADHNNGVTLDTWRDGLDGVDARTLQFSVQAGCDISPLIHFWGIKPVNAAALGAKMKAKGLGECLPVLCLLKRYRTLVPADNAAFNTFFEKIHPGRPIVASDDKRFGRGWYNVWRDTYGAAEGTAAVAQLTSVIDTYFTNKDASCAGQITATSDVARPCNYSWLPEGSPTTFACSNGTNPSTTTGTGSDTGAGSTGTTTDGGTDTEGDATVGCLHKINGRVCKTWSDGCNTCACKPDGTLGACTQMACFTEGTPMCKTTYEGSYEKLSGASKAGLAATGAFALATAAAALGLSQWVAAPQRVDWGQNKLKQ
jgi:hypothetical protein